MTISRSARAVLSAVALLVAGACSAGGMVPTPMPTATPASTGPVSYPGWPPDDDSQLLPIPVTSELAVGQNRFLLNLVDEQNEPLASLERGVTMRFYDLATDHTTPALAVEGTYLPTVAELPGLYRANVTFDRAGDWGLEVVTDEPDGASRSGRMIFSVRPTSSTPAIGAHALASETPTASSPEEIAAISTDRQPNPDFYRLSVNEALAAGRPFLLIFATPAFCRTATCAPALDIVKSVAPDYAGHAEFIHVEPYELEMVGGQLQPALADGQLQPVESVREWGLLTEPYIVVVDGEGKVSAKFEGVASADEIRAALDEVTERD